jgi:hypothetical protein
MWCVLQIYSHLNIYLNFEILLIILLSSPVKTSQMVYVLCVYNKKEKDNPITVSYNAEPFIVIRI